MDWTFFAPLAAVFMVAAVARSQWLKQYNRAAPPVGPGGTVFMARQGDVLIRRVDPARMHGRRPGELPRADRPLQAFALQGNGGERDIVTSGHPRDAGRVVLAYGETTGHAHAIAEPGVVAWQLGGPEHLLLEVPAGGAVVRHEEHSPVNLDPGTYEVVRQREATDTDQARWVAD